MTLVILGTQDKTFERLMKNIDLQIEKGNITGEVIVQAGSTEYQSDNMKIFDLIPMDKFNQLMEEAELVITHGGVGSILSALRANKKVIAVARLKKYGEHENDHQLQIIEEFSKLGYILPCNNLDNLPTALENIKNFEPKKYISNNSKMINILEEYIDNL